MYWTGVKGSARIETTTHLKLEAQEVNWYGVFPGIILLSTSQERLNVEFNRKRISYGLTNNITYRR